MRVGTDCEVMLSKGATMRNTHPQDNQWLADGSPESTVIYRVWGASEEDAAGMELYGLWLAPVNLEVYYEWQSLEEEERVCWRALAKNVTVNV